MLALWDVLWQLDYPADGLYINLGIDSEDDYSDESERYAREFAAERALKLHIVNVQEHVWGNHPADGTPDAADKQRALQTLFGLRDGQTP